MSLPVKIHKHGEIGLGHVRYKRVGYWMKHPKLVFVRDKQKKICNNLISCAGEAFFCNGKLTHIHIHSFDGTNETIGKV